MASRSRWKNIPAPLETGTSAPHLFTEKPQPKKHRLIGQDFKDERNNRRYVVTDTAPKKNPEDPNEEMAFIARPTSARLGDTSQDLRITLSELDEKVGEKITRSLTHEKEFLGQVIVR